MYNKQNKKRRRLLPEPAKPTQENLHMDQKIMIFGLGLTGNALLDILLEEKTFPTANILVSDQKEGAFAHFDSSVGIRENRFLFHMDRKNYTDLLSYLTAGDYFVCLAEGIEHCVLMETCLQSGIHFICSSDDCFYDEQNKYFLSEQEHLKQAAALRQQYEKAATSILQFGCNPGLVSIFTKKALKDIVYEDTETFVSQNRWAMIRLLEHREYAALAEYLGVRRIIEIDLDTTRTDIEEDPHTLYSTWNTTDFETEMNRRALFKLGTLDSLKEWLEDFQITADQLHYYNRTDGTVILERSGKKTFLTGKGPGGGVEACVIPHEELFSLYEYLSVRNQEEEIRYAPTVMFLYRPCPLAFSSLFHADNRRCEPIVKDRVISGGETVGISIEGEKFCPRFVYTKLLISPPEHAGAVGEDEEPAFTVTPTVYQVAASLYCAIKYIIRHPEEGVLYPENLDADEVLSDVSLLLPVFSVKAEPFFTTCRKNHETQRTPVYD